MPTLTIGLCQFDIAWEDHAENCRRITRLLDAADPAADWLIFPEMTLTGFSLDDGRVRRTPEDEAFFADIAVRRACRVTYGCVADAKNLSVTLDRTGKICAKYAKIHLYSRGGEDRARERGDTAVTVSFEGFRVTPVVCYDLRFADLFWETGIETDLFAVIANWPVEREEMWMTLLRARAIENQTYVVGVNRTGATPEIRYAGRSVVFGPRGETVLDGGREEGIFTARISTETVAEVRAAFQVLKDRRSDFKRKILPS